MEHAHASTTLTHKKAQNSIYSGTLTPLPFILMIAEYNAVSCLHSTFTTIQPTKEKKETTKIAIRSYILQGHARYIRKKHI